MIVVVLGGITYTGWWWFVCGAVTVYSGTGCCAVEAVVLVVW